MKARIESDKIEFLLKCGYEMFVIDRCSLEMQEDMYRHEFRSRYGAFPSGVNKYKQSSLYPAL